MSQLVATAGRYQASPPLRCGSPISLETFGHAKESLRPGSAVFEAGSSSRFVEAPYDHKANLGLRSTPDDESSAS